MAALLRIPFCYSGKLFYVVGLVALGWMHSSELHAQNTYAGCCPPYGTQDVTRPRITYGGRIFLSFPNYDVFLGGAPTRVEDLATGQGVQGPRVIYRNNQGMRWDGNEFFLHPAYPVDQVTKYRYFNRVVGEDEVIWPQSQTAPATTGAVTTGAETTSYPTGYLAPNRAATYRSAAATTNYPTTTAYSTATYSYPTTYPGQHRPMPNTVRFSGNAWGYEPHTDPAAVTPIYESPGAIISPPVTPATGRVRQQ